MNEGRFDYLKREIKRTYKRYIGERSDGVATLSDVLKLFNISIGEDVIDDYKITKFDYDTPSIEVTSLKDNTKYYASYTANADLLNYVGTGVKFIRVAKVSDNKRLDSLYYIGRNEPIIERLTFSDGNYDLVFEREMPNSVSVFVNSNPKIIVRYLENLERDGKMVEQYLLSKKFVRMLDEGRFSSFDQNYTYSLNNYIEINNSQNKYIYYIDNDSTVIYGIQDLKVKNLCHYFSGICFEDSNVNKELCMPLNMDKSDPVFSDDNVSVLVFMGSTDEGIYHNLRVNKNKDNDIYLNYEAFKWEYYKDEKGAPQRKRVVVASKNVKYTGDVQGYITDLEIEKIINDLEIEFEENNFIKIVIDELKTFIYKMNVQKGKVHDEVDMLSPRIFMDMTFDEIDSLITKDKDYYFKLANEQFIGLTDGIKEEKGKVRVLKQDM